MNTYRATANCQDVYSDKASQAGVALNSSALEGNLAGLLRNNTVIVSEAIVIDPVAGAQPERLRSVRIHDTTAKVRATRY
jgi:hypothetical protein